MYNRIALLVQVYVSLQVMVLATNRCFGSKTASYSPSIGQSTVAAASEYKAMTSTCMTSSSSLLQRLIRDCTYARHFRLIFSPLPTCGLMVRHSLMSSSTICVTRGRQFIPTPISHSEILPVLSQFPQYTYTVSGKKEASSSVSYTHLTLPTNREV